MKIKKPGYALDTNGAFVIRNYNFSKPFANFFPGIAGKYGIPMWVFYVNRCQAISCFGTKDKDHAMLEFYPANKAWQNASTLGFRTFIKIRGANKGSFYEPFQNGCTNKGFDLTNSMRITAYDLRLEEVNATAGLQVTVEYFTIPQEPFAGLTRKVTITNLLKKHLSLSILDGLPQIVPFGTNNFFLKKMGRTIEAWIRVENLEKGVPFYKLTVDPSDKPEVVHIREGNFYLGFQEKNKKSRIISPLVVPELIFGPCADFSTPLAFLNSSSLRTISQKGKTSSKTPCAFLPLEIELGAYESKTFYAVAGYMRSLETLNAFVPKIACAAFLEKKKRVNQELIENLQQDIDTASSSSAFNFYAKQTLLDNILRGGYPLTFKSGKVFYLYSRKHGDLERDYNKFLTQNTYFSQGNGNYRDVNQNRRMDVWFHPEIKEENVTAFFNLLQTDGFNPLVVKGAVFELTKEEEFKNALAPLTGLPSQERILTFLRAPFAPGELILFLQDNRIRLNVSYDEFLEQLMHCCAKINEAEHGEGFWSDHWTYNLDLLEQFLSVYPEEKARILLHTKCFTYFDNSETVRPRSEKYILYQGQPRQLHSISLDPAKKELIKKRQSMPHIVREAHGNGAVYYTTLINKLLCLFANKIASLDPSGMGIEMEANKPNWFDALNGLPALFGSSLCETFELKRLIVFMQGALREENASSVAVTKEVHGFLTKLYELLKDDVAGNEFVYWDKSYALKEEFRHDTKLGVSGKEAEATREMLDSIFTAALAKVNRGIAKAQMNSSGLYCGYFYHEVIEYTSHSSHITPTKFALKKLPLFLEGQMHALRVAEGSAEARRVHRATKKSPLYDSALKMYKVTASLSSMPEEIGRCRVFAPGWLENESIWLHMEYKYLVEVLRKGLCEEFYADFKNALIPFQDAKRYGRSILENSSFLVSSAFSDPALRGNGFVARLSGSTAEFLEMWLLMNVGVRPFALDDQQRLTLTFRPALASWLFNKKDTTYAFNFLSGGRVTYTNPKMKNTFGKGGITVKKICFTDSQGTPVTLTQETIPAPYASQIRSREIKAVTITLE